MASALCCARCHFADPVKSHQKRGAAICPSTRVPSCSRTLNRPATSRPLSTVHRRPRLPRVGDGSRVVCTAAGSRSSQLREAAMQMVDFFVKSNMVVGLGGGPGSTVAIEYIGSKLREGSLKNVVGIPISTESATAAARVGLPLTAMHPDLKIDMAFDDADLVQEGTINSIMGRRTAENFYKSLIKEKAMAKAAETYVLVIEEAKFVDKLEGAVPVIVEPANWEDTAEELDDLFLGDAEIWRRPSFGETGPSGGDRPLVTEQGHYMLDIIFTEPINDAVATARAIEEIPGVVAHGLFLEDIYAAAVGGRNGVKIRTSLFKSMFEEPASPKQA